MEIRLEIKAEPKVVRAGSLALQQMGEGAQWASAYSGPAVPGREMDVLSEAQPERLVCQKFKSFLLRFPFVPKR